MRNFHFLNFQRFCMSKLHFYNQKKTNKTLHFWGKKNPLPPRHRLHSERDYTAAREETYTCDKGLHKLIL